MPSGCLPSVWQRPAGSLAIGMSAAEKPLANHIVESVVSGRLAWRLLTDKAVHAQCINLGSTATLMWHTEVETKLHANNYRDCLIIQL